MRATLVSSVGMNGRTTYCVLPTRLLMADETPVDIKPVAAAAVQRKRLMLFSL